MYFAERAALDLSQVPVPRTTGPVELLVPMFAKPSLNVTVAAPEGNGPLLPFCEATLNEVAVVVYDLLSGDELWRAALPLTGDGLPPTSERERSVRPSSQFGMGTWYS